MNIRFTIEGTCHAEDVDKKTSVAEIQRAIEDVLSEKLDIKSQIFVSAVEEDHE